MHGRVQPSREALDSTHHSQHLLGTPENSAQSKMVTASTLSMYDLLVSIAQLGAYDGLAVLLGA